MSITEVVFQILGPLVPELVRLATDPPLGDREKEERAKQIGMAAIRAASDARARAEIDGA